MQEEIPVEETVDDEYFDSIPEGENPEDFEYDAVTNKYFKPRKGQGKDAGKGAGKAGGSK